MSRQHWRSWTAAAAAAALTCGAQRRWHPARALARKQAPAAAGCQSRRSPFSLPYLCTQLPTRQDTISSSAVPSSPIFYFFVPSVTKNPCSHATPQHATPIPLTHADTRIFMPRTLSLTSPCPTRTPPTHIRTPCHAMPQHCQCLEPTQTQTQNPKPLLDRDLPHTRCVCACPPYDFVSSSPRCQFFTTPSSRARASCDEPGTVVGGRQSDAAASAAANSASHPGVFY